jgi:hypothetical protein
MFCKLRLILETRDFLSKSYGPLLLRRQQQIAGGQMLFSTAISLTDKATCVLFVTTCVFSAPFKNARVAKFLAVLIQRKGLRVCASLLYNDFIYQMFLYYTIAAIFTKRISFSLSSFISI